LIMFVRAIEAFEVPALIGIPGGIPVFTSRIFLAIHQFPSDFGLAGSYAITLLLLSTVGVLIYHRLTGHAKRFATITGKGYRPRLVDLGRWRYATCGGALLIFAVTVALPVLVLCWVSVPLVPVIYGTFWLLLIAYITRFMPYGIRAASASMVQIHDDLEEAALACGSSWRQAFQRIILPLLMPGFVAGWIYVSTVSL